MSRDLVSGDAMTEDTIPAQGSAPAAEPVLRVVGLKKHFPVHRGVLSRVVGQVYAVDGVSVGIPVRVTGQTEANEPSFVRDVMDAPDQLERYEDAGTTRSRHDGRDHAVIGELNLRGGRTARP